MIMLQLSFYCISLMIHGLQQARSSKQDDHCEILETPRDEGSSNCPSV